MVKISMSGVATNKTCCMYIQGPTVVTMISIENEKCQQKVDLVVGIYRLVLRYEQLRDQKQTQLYRN